MFTKSDIADIYPLSPMQENILLHHRLYPEEKTTYLEQRSFRITGALDSVRLQEAFNRLAERHACLRTIFVSTKSKRSLQIVLKPRPIPWNQHDFSTLQTSEHDLVVGEIRKFDLQKGIDCERELPVRITLISLGNEAYELIWTMHHIVVDGWSAAILYTELLELYRFGVEGSAAQLLEVVPFSRYITWLEGRDQQQSLRFWQQELEGYQAEAVLPGKTTAKPEMFYDAHVFQLHCDRAVGERLNRLASQWQVTVSTMIHTLWGVLLGWYNDCDDVVFGSVVSGRPESLADAERMVGLCINTVPVRLRCTDGASIQQLALNLQKHLLAASDHHFCNLADIQNGTPVKQKLINHIIAVENFPRDSLKLLEGVTLTPTGSHEQISYDLALVVVPHDPFEIELRYNCAVYDDETVSNIAHHLRGLIELVVERPEILLKECEPLTETEHALLDNLNATAREFDSETTVSAIFARQAIATPTDPAVIDDEECVDYRQLSALAGAVAGYLRNQPNFQPGTRVAVMIDRCRWLPAALFGILRAGGVYVPLDPYGPASRATAILQDCGCNLILTVPHIRESIDLGDDIHVADVTRLVEEPYPTELVVSAPDDTAYIIYTSGSTGVPKGVAISHSSVVNFASWLSRYYAIDHTTRSTLFASPAFDASILEMIPTLTSGGSLHCARETMVDGEELITYYKEHHINLSFLPPMLCEEICRTHNGRLSPDFRLMTGADVLRYAGDGSLRVFNNYGPTEATVIATATEVTGLDADKQNIPIGFPIDNTECFILDHHGRNAAPSGVGELYIGGAGVAQGYVGRKDLTKERFLPHPVRKSERIYRTGDRVRLLPQGGLEFLGRIDNQIKIRGYRIEPSEIEQALRKHDAVHDAAVIDREDNSGPILVAFLVAKTDQKPQPEELRVFLRRTLPEYMIPTRLSWFERFPLTASGKIDREKLRKIQLTESYADGAENEPQRLSPIEEKLVLIWREVIGVNSVGRNDNFFALGGHSLSATRMASRIRNDLSVEISLRIIFDTPVLSDLAKYIEKVSNDM